MTHDDQIKWLADEAVKRLSTAARRDASAKDFRQWAKSRRNHWYLVGAKAKATESRNLREEAAILLAIENSVRQLKAAMGVA